VLRGPVVDFIDLKFWPVFNAADSAITIGCVLLVLFAGRERARLSRVGE
jgi:signal peptidase II